MTTDKQPSNSSAESFGKELGNLLQEMVQAQIKGDLDVLEVAKLIGARLNRLEDKVDTLLESVALLQKAAIHHFEKEERTN